MALNLGELVAVISADDSRFRKTLSSVKAGLDRVAGFAGFVALAGSATTFAAALAPAVGVVAAAPAALAAMKVASLGLQMALEGVGETLGAALVGDAKKFEESLKELPPSTRAVVSELGTAFGGLQKRVQESAFRPMRDEARGLGDMLRGPVQGGMSQVGAALGRIGAGVLAVARERRSLEFLRDLFNWTAGAIDGVGEGIPPLVRGLRDLGGVGLEYVDRAGAGLGALMGRVGRWLSDIARSGQATAWIDGAVAKLQQLGRIGTNLAAVFAAVFSAADTGAGDLLGGLEGITAQLAAWAESAEGQQQLASTFALLNETAANLAGILPLLVGPLGLIADLLGALPGGTQGTAAQFLAWSLAVGLVTSRLGPLVSGLGMVGGGAAKAVRALSDADSGVRRFASRVGTAAASFVASAARMTASAAVTAGRVVASWALMAAQAMARAVVMAAAWVVAMGPVGWIVAAAIAAVALIIANWDKVKRFVVETLPRALRAGFTFMVNLIKNAAKFGFLGPIPLIISHWGRISRFFTSTLPGAVRRGVDNVVGWIRSLPGRLLNAVGNIGSLLYGTGRDIVVGLWNGLVGMSRWLYDKVWSWIRAVIPDPIERALGIASPSRLMAERGRNVAEGLVLGMDDRADQVERSSERLATRVTRGFRRTDLIGRLDRFARTVPAPAVPAGSWRTDLIGVRRSKEAGSSGAADHTEITVRFESDDADLLRRIRKHVRIKGGGNVQLAFGTNLRAART